MGAEIRVFIEAERGSRDKHSYDEQTLERLRTVRLSAAYPFPTASCSARPARMVTRSPEAADRLLRSC